MAICAAIMLCLFSNTSVAQVLLETKGNCAPATKTPSLLEHAEGTAPFRSLAHSHCMVTSDQSPFIVVGKLWIEGLYFCKQKSSCTDSEFTLGAKDGAELWLTNVVVQGTRSGNHECARCGLDAPAGAVHTDGEFLYLVLMHESNDASAHPEVWNHG